MEKMLQVKSEAQGEKARLGVVLAKPQMPAKPLQADAERWLHAQALSL